MAADSNKALAPTLSILEYIHCGLALPSNPKTLNRFVPEGFAGLQCLHGLDRDFTSAHKLATKHLF
jgi:hypothetical protein